MKESGKMKEKSLPILLYHACLGIQRKKITIFDFYSLSYTVRQSKSVRSFGQIGIVHQGAVILTLFLKIKIVPAFFDRDRNPETKIPTKYIFIFSLCYADLVLSHLNITKSLL